MELVSQCLPSHVQMEEQGTGSACLYLQCVKVSLNVLYDIKGILYYLLVGVSSHWRRRISALHRSPSLIY